MEDNERIFPDDKLVSMFRNGDSHAFEILLSRYDECIMRAIRKSTINNNDSVEEKTCIRKLLPISMKN